MYRISWHRVLTVGTAVFIGIVFAVQLLANLDSGLALTPNFTIRYIAPNGNDAGNDCASSNTPCATIQQAVDASLAGDEIRVATGVYIDVHIRNGLPQIVYISETVTLRGGFTTTNWVDSFPISQPTTLNAQGNGRVLYISGNITPSIEGLRLTGGNAAGLVGDPNGEDAGGGVYGITATITISHSQIVSNIATAGGGAYFLNSPNTWLINNTITSNTGLVRGGGLYFRNSPETMLEDNVISNNEANHIGMGQKHYGGIYFLSSNNAMLISNLISENFAANDCGGVCFRDSDNAFLASNVISGNIARQQGFFGEGAGLYFYASQGVYASNNIIRLNHAHGNPISGTLLGGGVFASANASVSLISNTIDANQANNGGGVYIGANTTVTLGHNIIVGNVAISAGGGIYMINAAPAIIANHIFSNTTFNDGAGLFVDDNASPILINNIIARNQANSDGGGIYIDFFSTPSIINNTIVANDPQGIFMFNSPSPIILNNNIVSHAYGIWGTSPSITLDYNNVWNCSINCYFGISSGPNDLSVDPRFVDPVRLDYHLQVDSPVIDAGTNSGAPGEDFEGDLRPLDGKGDGLFITDIGADEYSLAALEVSKQAVPDPVLAGKPLTYIITITNTGNVTLTAIITDILPTQVSPNKAHVWPSVILEPGNIWSDTIQVTANIGYEGVLTNILLATAAEGVAAIYTETSQVIMPKLEVTKLAGSDIVSVGGQLTYTIYVTNTGNVTLMTTITDILPAQVTTTNTLTYTTLITPGHTWTEQIVVTVNKDACPLINNVVVTVSENPTEIYTTVAIIPCLVYLPFVTSTNPQVSVHK